MGYPSTVDIGVATPLILNTPGVENCVTGTAITAGSAYFSLITIFAPVTVAQMRCHMSGTPTGNIDLGIYDATGTNGAPNNLLGHTGAAAATTGVNTKSMTANLLLSPGIYWIAFLDTVADTVLTRPLSATGMGACLKTTAANLTVLPATAGTVADVNQLINLYALVSGGYS